MFNIIKQVGTDVLKNNNGFTAHLDERLNRFRFALELGEFNLYASYVVDTGHENGLEIHSVYENGVIAIANQNTLKIVTVLIARPAQVKRYGIQNGNLLFKAYQHTLKGYNQI